MKTQEVRTLLQTYKQAKGCAACGAHSELCFSYLPGQTKEVSIMGDGMKAQNQDRLLSEIAKTEVLCRDCSAEFRFHQEPPWAGDRK